MVFPATPNNGDTITIASTLFKYVATSNQWIGVVQSSTSGGSSMAAPSSHLRFSMYTSVSNTQHTTSQGGYYPGQPIDIADCVLFQSPTTQIQATKSASSYGTAVDLDASTSQYASLPTFASTAAYLASNPTYNGTNGAFISTTDGKIYYTNNSGSTFNSIIPQPTYSGKILMKTAGKFKLDITHRAEFTTTMYGVPRSATIVTLNGAIVDLNYWAEADYGIIDANSTLRPKLLEKFSVILDAPANAVVALGIRKLGYSNQQSVTTSHYIQANVESLF